MNSIQSSNQETAKNKNTINTPHAKKNKSTKKTKNSKNETVDNHLDLLSQQLKNQAETIRLIKAKRSQEEKR